MFGFHSIKLNNETNFLLKNVIPVHFSNIAGMLEHHLLPTVINDSNKWETLVQTNTLFQMTKV